MALRNQDLSVELIPDSAWRHRSLQSSITSKLSCTTDLWKTNSLSMCDVEKIFLLGPETMGWRWRRTINCPQFSYALKDTGNIQLHQWEVLDLEAIDQAIERGWLYLEPIDGSSRGRELTYLSREPNLSNEKADAEIREGNSEECKIARNSSVSNAASPPKKPGLANIEASNNNESNSQHTESPPTSSPTPTSQLISSSSSSVTNSKSLSSSHNNLVDAPEIVVSRTISQIREEFNNLQREIFNKFYGNLIQQHILEVRESLNEQHLSEMVVINNKLAALDAHLAQVIGENSALEADNSKLRDQLQTKSNGLHSSMDECKIKDVYIQRCIITLFRQSTLAKEERERIEMENLALIEKGKTLQRELDESHVKMDGLNLANLNLSRKVQESAEEKNKANANEVKWKEEFEALKCEVDAKFDKSSQVIIETTKRRLELEEERNRLEDEISKIRATDEAEVADARTTGECDGRKTILQDLNFIEKGDSDGIQRAHMENIQLARNTEYNQGWKDGQSTETSEKMLQSLAATAILEQKETPIQSIQPEQGVSQGLHERSAAGCAEHQLTASERLERSPVPSTVAPLSTSNFNIHYELGLLTQYPGREIIPSKLTIFNHAFLGKTLGGFDAFWNTMQLTQKIGTRNIQRGPGWPRILKIHDGREPHSHFEQQPSIGKHGALLLIRGLDDKYIPEMEYPTFLNTVQGHAVYIGQYKVVKQHVNETTEPLLGLEFLDYLTQTPRGKRFFLKRTGDRTVGEHSVITAFDNGNIRTSWTVLKYVGFDLKGYEALLTQYSQIQPFCRRKKGIPLEDVDGGFEHTLLNEILNSSSTKRVHDVDDGSGSERKRAKIMVPISMQPQSTDALDKSQRQDTRKLPSVQELEDEESTIVVDVSPRRLQLLVSCMVSFPNDSSSTRAHY
ncbi:hypothetical protein NHQ30_006177 [Ciborinia camelliae]|nr:hypothetical protein NHQ30_006177 [Ciborinia camelliae]